MGLSIAFGNHEIEIRSWLDGEMLLGALDACDAGRHVVGNVDEARQFHSIIVRLQRSLQASGGHFGIGLFSIGFGLEPVLFPQPERHTLALGFDMAVVGIDVDRKERSFEYPLPAPFYAFLPVPSTDSILIFHEIGVVAVSHTWEKRWEHWRDLVKNIHVRGQSLEMHFHDAASFVIDLRTGKLA